MFKDLQKSLGVVEALIILLEKKHSWDWRMNYLNRFLLNLFILIIFFNLLMFSLDYSLERKLI
jgi:hypothetical protein